MLLFNDGIAFSDLYPVANERNATDLIYMAPVFGVKVLFILA